MLKPTLLPEHPLFSISDPRTRQILLVSFAVGFLVAYISWIVGAIFALIGTQSLIRSLRHRRQWLQALEQHARRSTVKTQGRIQQKIKVVDAITDDVSFQVTMEYTAVVDGFRKPTTKTLTGLAARALYQDNDVQEGQSISLQMIPGKRLSAIPTTLWNYKLQDCLLWTIYLDGAIAFVGLHTYLLGALAYAWLVSHGDMPAFWLMVCLAVVSPILMGPYIVVEQQVRHRQRMEHLSNDPVALTSELDVLRNLWHALGPTLPRKLYALLFALGFLEMISVAAIGVVPGCLAVGTFTLLASTTVRTKREFWERFSEHAKRVEGSLLVRHSTHVVPEQRAQQQLYLVTFRYTAPTGDFVEKEISSKELYGLYLKQEKEFGSKRSTAASFPIDILVLPDQPLSGYPADLVAKDLANSWTLTKLQVVAFFSIMGYLIACWITLMDDLYENLVEDVVLFGVVVLIGPIMMLPQASVMHRVRYKKLIVERLRSGCIIVDHAAPEVA
jgi:uncharacterized membrane protein YbaN (DUF454 family)